MPLTIHCSMCGANIELDDQAIRREVVTCSHCSTVQRITSRGTEKTPLTPPGEKAPAEVKVVREGSGTSASPPGIHGKPSSSTARNSTGGC